MNGQAIHATLLEGVRESVLDSLKNVLEIHDEPVVVNAARLAPFWDDDWLAPALVQIDTYWLTAFFDAMLGNLQEDTQDEDIQNALIEALLTARRARTTWITMGGSIPAPIFRLRAFLEAHRSIHFTIPADVDDETLRVAVETLGDAVGYGTNAESELSHDGSIAGVFEVQMVFVDAAGMWMEAHFDSDEDWDEDEEDSEISF